MTNKNKFGLPGKMKLGIKVENTLKQIKIKTSNFIITHQNTIRDVIFMFTVGAAVIAG